MSEEQIEIMNIIEPYMDKTLTEWCYCKQQDWCLIKLNKDRADELISFRYVTWAVWGWIIERENVGEILWHYDITAVLKYIEEIIWMKKYKIYQDCFVLEENNNWKMRFIKIPNNPLHLYTEQENKDLLKLLKKLWK